MTWVIQNKEYAPLYSAVVASVALIFSIFSFIISNMISRNRIKKEKEISNARYEEQRKQYEERLKEERKRREEDRNDMEKRNRVSEEPYLVFKKSKVVSSATSQQIIIRMEFLNKGRGSAYEIIPDVDCIAKPVYEDEFQMHRYGAVEDPIANVGEIFVVNWSYIGKVKQMFRIAPSIKFADASGRRYKQTYCIDIIDSIGNANIINFAQPQRCEEQLRPQCD